MFEDISPIDFKDDILETSYTANNDEKNFNKSEHKENITSNILWKDKQFVDTSFSSPNKVVKRKFPGPAGLSREVDLPNYEDHSEDNILCSQQTYALFEDGPWKEFITDYGVSETQQLHEKFDIAWIKNNYKDKAFVNCKAPFLAAFLDNLEIIKGKIPTINVTLKDRTGSIQGTLLYSLYEEHAEFLTIGSVLVLKQFGVLSSQKYYCITITPNSLLRIYHNEISKHSGDDQRSADGSVKKTVVQESSVEEIWKEYYESLEYSQRKSSGIEHLVKNTGSITSNCSSSLNISGNKNSSRVSSSSTDSISVLDYARIKNGVTCHTNCSDAQNRVNQQSVLVDGKTDEVHATKKFKQSPSTCSKLTESTSLLNDNHETALKISDSRVTLRTDKEHSDIWEKLFQGVDSSFFDDF